MGIGPALRSLRESTTSGVSPMWIRERVETFERIEKARQHGELSDADRETLETLKRRFAKILGYHIETVRWVKGRDFRLDVQWPVEVDTGNRVQAALENISLGGARLRISTKLKKDAIFRIRIDKYGFQCPARAMWSKKLDDGSYIVGCQLRGLTGKQREFLVRLMCKSLMHQLMQAIDRPLR